MSCSRRCGTSPQRRTPDGTPPRVLAIDDDPIAIELIEAVLQPEGYTVLKATSGEAGIALAQDEQPSVVILDLLMPGLDGFAVVDRLRATSTTANTPIVILTSKSLSAEEQERLKGTDCVSGTQGGVQPGRVCRAGTPALPG